jgi:hypothetical protein
LANGKTGTEGGPLSGHWGIEGNRLIAGGASGAIILLDPNYFIYRDRDTVFFQSRVKE